MKRKATHISTALQPVLDQITSRGARAISVKRQLLDDNISGCCGAPLVTESCQNLTRYRCSQCRRTERIG